MNQIQMSLMNILNHIMQGRAYELFSGNPMELKELFVLAEQQNILPMVCEAVYQSECIKKNQPFFKKYQKKAIDEFVSQTIRTAQFLDLLSYLAEKGLYPLIVKGMSVRKLYFRDNLRISVDEDLLIEEKEIEGYHEALISYGLKLMSPDVDIQKESEISYVNSESGLYIEIHKYLFDPKSEAYGELNLYFEKKEYIEETYQNCTFRTLKPTDHLFFLLCHSLKHFFHSGFGIRQICDIAIFSDHYAEEIDWKEFMQKCEEIHADGFAKAIFQIADRYLLGENNYKIYLEKWNISEIDIFPILDDILSSGAHGASEMTRLHSSTITVKAVGKYKTGQKKYYSIFSSVFLPVTELKYKYNYLQKYPILLPVAWMQRIAGYMLELLKGKKGRNNITDSIRLGKERIELFKLYGIIK